jgi:hypothetical protein
MNNLFSWMKSTRSVLAILAMILLFVVVIGTLFATGQIGGEVLALVSMVIGSVITAYFGKRDTPEDQGK